MLGRVDDDDDLVEVVENWLGDFLGYAVVYCGLAAVLCGLILLMWVLR